MSRLDDERTVKEARELVATAKEPGLDALTNPAQKRVLARCETLLGEIEGRPGTPSIDEQLSDLEAELTAIRDRRA